MFAAKGNTRKLLLALIVGAGMAVAGCSGSDGADGAAGPAGPAGPPGPSGPTGPSGPQAALDIATAQAVTGTITAVTGTPARPTVNFRLVNELGQPVRGLAAGDFSVLIAKLVPGTAGGSSQWVSYINRNETPAASTVWWGTQSRRQATARAGNLDAAVFVDNRDGSYTYTFGTDLTNYTANPVPAPITAGYNPGPGAQVTFEPTLPHRVSIESRRLVGTPSRLLFQNNPVLDYLPSTGAVTNLPAARKVVDTQTCNTCHDRLAFHGSGSRQDAESCVLCHNPGTIDAQSNNSLDMTVMIHKIHAGIELPTVASTRPNTGAPIGVGNQPVTTPASGKGYTIWGNGQQIHNYNTILFTQDQRNCRTCHQESDAATPQASNWRLVANTQACGTCHDNVNFATGQGHSSANLPSTDADCLTCHGPAGLPALRTENVHVIPEQAEAAKFRYQVLSVTGATPGNRPTVTVRVVNPQASNAPYNILATGNPFLTGSGRLVVDVAWQTETSEFLNIGTPQTGAPFQPIQIVFTNGGVATPGIVANADGSFTLQSATALPPATAFSATGASGVAILEGRPVVAINGVNTSLAVKGEGIGFRIVGTGAPRARTQLVSIQKCNDCHQQLTIHGANRTDNTDLCATCHNPNATDVNQRTIASNDPLFPAPGAPATRIAFSRGTCVVTTNQRLDETIDFKYMVHAIHAGKDGYDVCGNGATPYDFSNITYVGRLNNCEGCHLANTYYPSSTLVPVTIHSGPADANGFVVTAGAASRADLTDDRAITGQSATCAACHTSTLAKTHMEQNGGVLTPTVGLKGANGQATSAGQQETCAVCHGPGRSGDVKTVHGIGNFRFN